MEKKRVLLIGYTKMNLGDDLFLSMVINRYPNVEFDLHVSRKYQTPFNRAKNVNFIYSNIDNINVEDYCMATYVAGSIFGESTNGYKQKEWLNNFVLRFKKAGIPFLFISSNYGPCYTKKWFKICDSIISNAYQVNLRDKYSKNNFRYKHVKYIPDLVLSMSYKKKKTEKDTVGISVIDMYDCYRNNLNHLYFDYLNFLKNNIIKLIEDGKKIYLFSFCKYEGDDSSVENLLKLIDCKYYSDIQVVSYNGNINKFLNIYSRMEYMLCTRFHSMILSHLFNQKIYVCSYSDKLFNVIQSYNFKYNFLKIDDNISSVMLDLNKFKKSKITLVEDSRKNFDVMDEILNIYGKINCNYSVGNFYGLGCKKRLKILVSSFSNKIGVKDYLKKIKNIIRPRKTKVININENNIKLLDDSKGLGFLDSYSYQNCLMRLGYKYKDITVKEVKEGPLVSFVIPTYKRDNYLFECVDSILFQSYKNIEIIIVDDYTDSDLESKLKEKYKNRKNIIYIKNKVNSKAGISRRNGYNLCKGKYIVFCDDDDFYIDYDFVKKSVNILEKDSSINFVGFNCFTYRQYENSISYRRYSFEGKCRALDYITSFQINYFKPFPSCAMFRKCVLDKYNFKEMKMMNDSSIFLNAMQEDNIYISRELVMFYRVHSANITNSLNAQFIIDNLEEKYKVYLNLKNNNLIPNVDEWWFQQVMLTVNYFIKGSRPNDEEIIKLNSWVLEHLNYKNNDYIVSVKKLKRKYTKKVD